ncbi:hypothetical protein A3C91_03960 [Candidatus Azambacteria bacterium RIFCSPHIGHO2_02_FULL_52_12]|uniref:Uncharacterized protein n=1 Tax=Candidatus Azambacteria bacterium RIFCSPLOWO2_01_FULL_46_25 TaxID=1797298 RepID=A0A1F5BV21_9BACT|nr:MAG: hypothetical protein A3C91_03960 [Candidatus Azambacteria bacterium RIFCSPHIGHO2_02_FULL_52_12]OGD34408.1 MAG: hypothetical protein A2988_02675 [Candidatus Azambacteria bacterium RIFCSPLOWO2_01_FULL_46_25]OGD37314.1 MAG: hypothetical protein A2850_01215 [Candidatus Azambacteria bacterium RIFCSPHIGHO2_01_FULL_51_74]
MSQTQIVFSVENVLESVKIVAELYPDLRLNGLYYYFPFTDEQLHAKEYVKEQIKHDSRKIDIKSAAKELVQFWNNNKKQIQTALDILRNEGKIILSVYKCNLTFYGSYGYYYAPDTLFLNVSKGNSEFWSETFLHELLHLVLYNEILSLPYNESEVIVDKIFIRLFGSMFPNYQKQF